MASSPEQRNQYRQWNFGLRGNPTITPEQRVERAQKLRKQGRGTKNTDIRGK